MSNLIKRAITGLLFVCILVGCILRGEISFTLLFAIITAMSVYEFGTIVSKSGEITINRSITLLAGIFLFLAFAYLGLYPGRTEVLIPYLFLLIYLFVSELYLKRKNPIHNWAYTMLSQVYVALPFALLNVLAYHSAADGQSNYNPILPLSIFIFNWTNDTGAYCSGMLFGKHKLFERISPKKSWEGSVGGGLLSIAAAVIMSHFFSFMPVYHWVGLAITVVVFGTWGDLTESLLKRTLGIKDSGNILPGHGGMLDRFDSSLLAIPAAVVYLYLIHL